MSWQLPPTIMENFLQNMVYVVFENSYSRNHEKSEPSFDDLSEWMDKNALNVYAIEKEDALSCVFYFFSSKDKYDFIDFLREKQEQNKNENTI
jgi:hypothetical protein